MNKLQKTDLDIRLGNEKLEVKLKEYAKYLGIYIDSKLTWEKQIQTTNSKLDKGIGLTRTMSHFLQEKQLKLLFSAFISPYLDYGALAWGGAAMKIFPLELNIKLLQVKFMKKLILKEHPKIICDKYPFSSSDRTKLIVPYFRTNLGTCTSVFKGYKVWIEIPKRIKELSSIKLFKPCSDKRQNGFKSFKNQNVVSSYNHLLLHVDMIVFVLSH